MGSKRTYKLKKSLLRSSKEDQLFVTEKNQRNQKLSERVGW